MTTEVAAGAVEVVEPLKPIGKYRTRFLFSISSRYCSYLPCNSVEDIATCQVTDKAGRHHPGTESPPTSGHYQGLSPPAELRAGRWVKVGGRGSRPQPCSRRVVIGRAGPREAGRGHRSAGPARTQSQQRRSQGRRPRRRPRSSARRSCAAEPEGRGLGARARPRRNVVSARGRGCAGERAAEAGPRSGGAGLERCSASGHPAGVAHGCGQQRAAQAHSHWQDFVDEACKSGNSN